jgi:hypothetical protein
MKIKIKIKLQEWKRLKMEKVKSKAIPVTGRGVL